MSFHFCSEVSFKYNTHAILSYENTVFEKIFLQEGSDEKESEVKHFGQLMIIYFQDIGLLHLCEALKNPQCVLNTLVLWNNQISSSSIPALTEALIKNKNLQTLNLGQNAIQVNYLFFLEL